MKALLREARGVTIKTPLDDLRRIERELIEADTDDADLCLPRVEACIMYIIGN